MNPNNKIPAIVDRRGPAPITVIESGAILVHLAETTPGGDWLVPPTSQPAARAEVMGWLMWQMAGLGPMMGRAGRFVRETKRPAEEVAWVKDEFLDEVDRLWGVLEGQLQRHRDDGGFIAGAYSAADVACYAWMAFGWGSIPSPYAPLTAARPSLGRFTEIPRWLAAVAARPAVTRGMAVPKI